MAGRLIFLTLIAIPLIEIALFIVIGQAIGLWPTLLGVVVIALIGSALIRHQGLRLLAEIRDTMGRGQLPARALADGMLVSIAGVLMVTPGYFTDCLGLLLLIPAVRSGIYRLAMRHMRIIDPTTGMGPRGPGDGAPSRPATIELDDDHFRPR